MTAKQKAQELYDKFDKFTIDYEDNKTIALICCDEVLGYMGADRGYSFWSEVKVQIEKL